MSQFNKFFNKSVDKDLEFAKSAFPGLNDLLQRVDDFLKPIYGDIAELRKTSYSSSKVATKENVGPSREENIRGPRTRSRRNALKESTQQNTDNAWTNVRVKTEKLSVLPSEPTLISGDSVAQKISGTQSEELSTDNDCDEEDEEDKTFFINKEPKREQTSEELDSTVVVENPVLVLKSEAKDFTPRLTRTQTRSMRKQEADNTKGKNRTDSKTRLPNLTKEKAKLTPRPPPQSATLHAQSAPNKNALKNNIVTASSSKSALKPSQAEQREKEKIRREKEEENQKKREAQIELKKKRNEEKQLRAQKQREVLEAERQKALEAQRARDEEKYKQVLAEQKEKKQKIREENEQKLLQAKLRAMEEKKREQARMMEEQQKAEILASKDKEMINLAQAQKQNEPGEQDPKPIYLQELIPYLPLNDCFDSDEDEYYREKTFPTWALGTKPEEAQQLAIGAGEHLKNTFFFRQAETADLQEIFEVIDPQKLRRHSSAVWQKPPRYTLLPTTVDDQEDENAM